MAFLPICREYLKVVFQRPRRVLLTHPPQSLALGYRITFRPLRTTSISQALCASGSAFLKVHGAKYNSRRDHGTSKFWPTLSYCKRSTVPTQAHVPDEFEAATIDASPCGIGLHASQLRLSRCREIDPKSRTVIRKHLTPFDTCRTDALVRIYLQAFLTLSHNSHRTCSVFNRFVSGLWRNSRIFDTSLQRDRSK